MDPLNREFVELLNASGWTSAEAARQLEVTPGLISQYRSGSTRPSPQMLRLFKLVLVGENPAALQAVGGSVTKYPEHKNEFGEMNDQLIELKKADPKAFATVKTMIESVAAQAAARAAERKEPAPVKAASGERRNDAAFLKKLATAHPLRSEVSERKPRAASTTDSKSAPRPPASKRPSSPPSPPAPVPVEREP